MPFGNAVGEGFVNGGIIIADKVIVFGPGQGVFVYSGAAMLGNPPIAAMTGSSQDPYGNAVNPEISSVSGTIVMWMHAGALNFSAGSQFTPGSIGSFGTAGECGISSGEATNTDTPANVIVDSAQASGIGVPLISLQSDQTLLNLQATQNIPSSNTNPGHNSAAPAAYSQAYEQANTNRINEILDVLQATGIWL